MSDSKGEEHLIDAVEEAVSKKQDLDPFESIDLTHIGHVKGPGKDRVPIPDEKVDYPIIKEWASTVLVGPEWGDIAYFEESGAIYSEHEEAELGIKILPKQHIVQLFESLRPISDMLDGIDPEMTWRYNGEKSFRHALSCAIGWAQCTSH